MTYKEYLESNGIIRDNSQIDLENYIHSQHRTDFERLLIARDELVSSDFDGIDLSRFKGDDFLSLI